jgi:hypothetical protein
MQKKYVPKNTLGVIKFEDTANYINITRYGKVCQNCGKVYIAVRYDSGNCSKPCSHISSRRRQSGAQPNFATNFTPRHFASEAEFWASEPENMMKPKPKNEHERKKRDSAPKEGQ